MPPESGRPSVEEAPGTPAVKPPAETPSSLADEFAPFGRLVKCQAGGHAGQRHRQVRADRGPGDPGSSTGNGRVIIPAGTEAPPATRSRRRWSDTPGASEGWWMTASGRWSCRGTPIAPTGGSSSSGRGRSTAGRPPSTIAGASARGGSTTARTGSSGTRCPTWTTRRSSSLRPPPPAGWPRDSRRSPSCQQPAAGVAGAFGATQVAPTLGNALTGSLGAGVADVMNEMAARIREEISKRGVYVGVPAGKAFYLFVEQTHRPQRRLGRPAPRGRKGEIPVKAILLALRLPASFRMRRRRPAPAGGAGRLPRRNSRLTGQRSRHGKGPPPGKPGRGRPGPPARPDFAAGRLPPSGHRRAPCARARLRFPGIRRRAVFPADRRGRAGPRRALLPAGTPPPGTRCRGGSRGRTGESSGPGWRRPSSR